MHLYEGNSAEEANAESRHVQRERIWRKGRKEETRLFKKARVALFNFSTTM